MTAVNPQLRAIALAGALALVAVLLGMWTLNRQQPGAVDTPLPPVAHRQPAHAVVPKAKATPAAAKPAAAKHGVAKPAAAPAAGHAATPAAKPVAKIAAKPVAKVPAKPAVTPVAKVPVKPRPAQVNPFERAALAAGLPKPIARQFAGHEVVVVTLYSPRDDVDRIAAAEAQSGAALGGAGFAAVDVSKDSTTADLTRLLGILSAPSSLVFSRADIAKPVSTLDGFADRQTIAQAALNADPTPGGSVGRSTWAGAADALCRRSSTRVAALGDLSTGARLRAASPKVEQISNSLLAGLGKLKPAAGRAGDVTRFLGLVRQDSALKLQAAAAAVKHDTAGVATATAQEATVSAQAGTLAVDLGAPSCAQPF